MLLACGFALASLAGLELAIREHFAGFRSHSALLAGAAAVVIVVPLFLLTGLPQVALLAVGVVVYALAFVALRRAFLGRTRRRSGSARERRARARPEPPGAARRRAGAPRCG